MKQTAVMIVENKVEAEAIALFDGELTFREFMDNINKHFNQAKQMEKEQIMSAREDGHLSTYAEYGSTPKCYLDGGHEQYYNETFKSESFCNCPKGKGIDFDENQKAYCIDCGKNINL